MIHHPIFSPEKFARLQQYCVLESLPEVDKGTPAYRPALFRLPATWADPRHLRVLDRSAPEMLDLVEPVIGPDIAIFACHLLRKPARVGKRVPWHEDSAYWKGALTPMTVASITIALAPSLPENGCLRVIPGTHKHGYSDYVDVARPQDEVFPIEVKASQMDETKAVDIALQPDEASIHHGKIIHGSNPNTGKLHRSVLTVRYFPTTVKFTKENHPHVCRGEIQHLPRARQGSRRQHPYLPDPTSRAMGGRTSPHRLMYRTAAAFRPVCHF